MAEPAAHEQPLVHPTAVVAPEARLGAGVRVGPYAVIEGEAEIGSGCSIAAHAVVQGPAILGEGVKLYPFAVAGTDPQDQKYAGERTLVVIGRGSVLREFSTVNRGTLGGGGKTDIGEHCYIMAHAHVAHDCTLGDRVVVANACSLAGHVVVGEHVVFGGMSAVGQYVRIGRGAFVAAGAMLERDLPPFAIAAGDRAHLGGVNVVGMRRLGLDAEARRAVKDAYALLIRGDMPLCEALAQIERLHSSVPEVRAVLDFISSSRGIVGVRSAILSL